MDDWPEVVILLVTYKRTDYAIKTIHGIQQYLHYPNLSWHIADDGSGAEHQLALIGTIGEASWSLSDTMQQGGTGLNRNTGLRHCFERTPYVLHIEDDWELREPLDLRPFVNVLVKHEDVGMIRMGYIEAGHLAHTVQLCGQIWWELDKSSKHENIFAGHPHLLHQRFHESYRYYPEGWLPGSTEDGLAYWVLNMVGPKVLYPLWRPWGIFAHIGTVKAEEFLPAEIHWKGAT